MYELLKMNITEDIAMFCRVCLQLPSETEMLDLNLIYDEEEQLTYSDCFTMCTKINICEDENLPQNLCRSCGLELQMAYDFHRKVEESKRLLIQLQEQQQTESTAVVTEVDIGGINGSQESNQEVVVEEEEHLDMEEYQAEEHLDEEDADTIQLKINSKSDGEEYIIEAITLSTDDEMAAATNTLKEQITWEDAVVAVANEQHLPVKREEDNAVIKTEAEIEETTMCDDSTQFEYEDEEVIDMEVIEEDDDDEESGRYKNGELDKETKILSVDEVQTKPARCRFIGRFSCDLCQKSFPNHSRMMLHRRSHMANRPKFPCPHCDRVYATKQAMDVHVRTVHIKNGFVCPICSKLYVIKKSLEVHLRYHTGDFPYHCDLCDKKFAQIGHLNTHRNVKHNSVRFSCEYPNCGKFFTSSTSLRNHEFTHSEMPFQCSYCDKGYPSKSKLKVHILRKHNLVLTLDELEPMRKFKTVRSKLNLVKVVEYLDYKIELCIKEETMEEQMQTEALVDGNNLMTEKDYKECTLPSNTDDNPTQIAEIKTEFVQQLSESESEIEEDFTFDDLYEKVFEDIKNEQLEEGNKKLATKVRVKRRRRGRPPLNRRSESEDDDSDLIFGGIELSLEGHQNEGNKNHNNESDATEKLMPEVSEFGHESDLNLTMSHGKPKRPRAHRTISSEQQGPPFVCEVCNLPCKSRALLNSHRFRKHRPQDAAQFNCPKCDRAFNNQQSLQRHLRRPTCEAYPQFDCEHCGKKCIGLSNYKIHLRFHKRQYPFVCHLCGKKFMMCVHLNEHVLVKHENKRYPCEHPGCGKLFQTRNSLYNHAYQHKGFMPYECEYCRRGYASKSRLRFHCKKSHNINHTIEELDRMQVTEKLPNRIVKAQ